MIRKYLSKIRKGLNSQNTTGALDFINSRPIPPNALRVLFIGNSLTMHAVTPGVWDIASGMAASSPEKDYVHLVVKGMQEREARPVEALYNNGGNGKLAETLEYLQFRILNPDIVFIQGGENDAFDDRFRAIYPALLDHYSAPRIIIGDWYEKQKSDYVRDLCLRRNIPFVQIYHLFANPSMSGNAGPYRFKGVSTHPNDVGMAAIAMEVLEIIQNSCK